MKTSTISENKFKNMAIALLGVLSIASAPFAQTADDLKECPVYSLSPMSDNTSCTSISLLGYQYSGALSSGIHRISLFSSDFNFSYFGLTTGMLEFEDIPYSSTKHSFSANLIYTVPAIIATFAEVNAKSELDKSASGTLRMLFTIPSNFSSFKFHLYEPKRRISIFSGLNSDLLIDDDAFGFISKSESGIRLKIGKGIFATTEILFGKTIFNSFTKSDHSNFLGLSSNIWLDGW